MLTKSIFHMLVRHITFNHLLLISRSSAVEHRGEDKAFATYKASSIVQFKFNLLETHTCSPCCSLLRQTSDSRCQGRHPNELLVRLVSTKCGTMAMDEDWVGVKGQVGYTYKVEGTKSFKTTQRKSVLCLLPADSLVSPFTRALHAFTSSCLRVLFWDILHHNSLVLPAGPATKHWEQEQSCTVLALPAATARESQSGEGGALQGTDKMQLQDNIWHTR